MGWDWNRFWADLQGPFTTFILGILAIASAIATAYGQRWLSDKTREQSARTQNAKLDSVMKLADVIVPAIDQKAKIYGGDCADKKVTAAQVLNDMTPNDVSPQLVDHVIEKKVAEMNVESENPPQKLEVEAKVEQDG